MKNLHEMTDEQLALAYIEGNNKAFDLLLERNQSKIFTYILYTVHDQEIANDIFQDTFVKVITHLKEGRYAPTGKFSAWLTRIAHNIIMDWYRDHKTGRIVEQQNNNDLSSMKSDDTMDSNRESIFVNEQIYRDIKKLMNQLPDTQREVVFMRFFQQLSFKEIAETTNVSINTSLGRMRYALINMRKMAKDHNIELQLQL